MGGVSDLPRRDEGQRWQTRLWLRLRRIVPCWSTEQLSSRIRNIAHKDEERQRQKNGLRISIRGLSLARVVRRRDSVVMRLDATTASTFGKRDMLETEDRAQRGYALKPQRRYARLQRRRIRLSKDEDLQVCVLILERMRELHERISTGLV